MRLRAWVPYLLLIPPGVAVLAERDRFPEALPLRWDANLVATQFVYKSDFALLIPLMSLALLMLLVGSILRPVSPNPPRAMVTLRQIAAPLRWMLALAGFPAAFAPLWGPIPWMVWAGITVVVVTVVVGRATPTPPGGYSNPADPRVIVPTRSGLGFTFNTARPVSRVLIALLIAATGVAFFWVRSQLSHRPVPRHAVAPRSP